jgi:hypothetical protein
MGKKEAKVAYKFLATRREIYRKMIESRQKMEAEMKKVDEQIVNLLASLPYAVACEIVNE